MFEEPQRHRDIEKAQCTLPLPLFRILDFGFRIFHPPTKKTQRHRNAETQSSVSLDSSLWRGSGRPMTAGNRWVGKPTRKRALVPVCRLSGLRFIERMPRHFSSSFNSWEGQDFSPCNEEEEKQNRRASGTSAGEKTASDECSHSERAGFLPVTGDPVACRSVMNERNRIPCSAIAPLGFWAGGWICVTCVICGQIEWAGGLRETFVSWCLRVCDVGGRMGSVFSVPLWFSDEQGKVPNSKFKTQNSNF
jgi:hypothetical protein